MCVWVHTVYLLTEAHTHALGRDERSSTVEVFFFHKTEQAVLRHNFTELYFICLDSVKTILLKQCPSGRAKLKIYQILYNWSLFGKLWKPCAAYPGVCFITRVSISRIFTTQVASAKLALPIVRMDTIMRISLWLKNDRIILLIPNTCCDSVWFSAFSFCSFQGPVNVGSLVSNRGL